MKATGITLHLSLSSLYNQPLVLINSVHYTTKPTSSFLYYLNSWLSQLDSRPHFPTSGLGASSNLSAQATPAPHLLKFLQCLPISYKLIHFLPCHRKPFVIWLPGIFSTFFPDTLCPPLVHTVPKCTSFSQIKCLHVKATPVYFCDRHNNATTPQRFPCPNWNQWIYYPTWQKGLCRCA